MIVRARSMTKASSPGDRGTASNIATKYAYEFRTWIEMNTTLETARATQRGVPWLGWGRGNPLSLPLILFGFLSLFLSVPLSVSGYPLCLLYLLFVYFSCLSVFPAPLPCVVICLILIICPSPLLPIGKTTVGIFFIHFLLSVAF